MSPEHYLIDGYNLLFSLTGGGNLKEEREALIFSLNEMCKKSSLNVVVIFDGAYDADFSRSHFDAIEIVFSPYRMSADDYILDLLETIPKPGKETVVTSDKDLAKKSRDFGAKTLTVKFFFRWLMSRSKKKTLKEEIIPQFSKHTIVTPEERDMDRLEEIFKQRLKKFESGSGDK